MPTKIKLVERLGPPLLLSNEEAVEKRRRKKRRREDNSDTNDEDKWLGRKEVRMWHPGKADEVQGEWSYTRQRSAFHHSSKVHRTGSSAMAAHMVRQVLVLFIC